MADKQSSAGTPTPTPAPATKQSTVTVAGSGHKRQQNDVTVKFHNLSAAARAEILEEVLNKEVITKQFGSFTNFLREQSVIGIGIGLVFGTQTKTVVDSIMNSLVNPLTKLVLPGKQSLAERSVHLNFHGRSADLIWGAVVYSFFSFLMVALVVYAIYRLLHLDKLAKKKDA